MSTSKSGYIVNVLSPTGEPTAQTFTSEAEGKGISGGIAAAVDPLSGCDVLEFSGRPDLLKLSGGEVLRAFIRDRTGALHSVFYGAVIPNNTTEGSGSLEGYQANARALLIGSACNGETYKDTDTAAIAYDLASKNKHVALNVRASDFPASGSAMPEFTAIGQLGEVLDELLTATADADYGSGVSPEGYVFFKPNRAVLEVPYVASDYEGLPQTAPAITTAVRHIFNEPPAIAPWSGAYVPKPYTHLSIPDAELHAKYGYTRTKQIPPYAFTPEYDASYIVTGFSNPANAVDASVAPPSVKASGTAGSFRLDNPEPTVLGVRLRYMTAETVEAVRFRAWCGVLYDVALPNTQGEVQELDIILPPHAGTFTRWEWFRFSCGATGIAELHAFYLLRLDIDALDSTTRAIVPEAQPGQLVRDGIGSNPSIVKLLDGPRGTKELENAGLRWTWTPQEGDTTVTDLSASAFEAEFSGKNKLVRSYYRS